MKKFIVFALGCCLLLPSMSLRADLLEGRVPVAARINANSSDLLARHEGEKLATPSASYSLFSPYTSSYYGVYHFAVLFNDAFSIYEGSVELEDGSIWTIWYEDLYKTANWLDTDLIVISRNPSLFSSYDYLLTNQNTGVSILANLYMGPLYDSLYRRWIIAVDDYYNYVYLDDGSVWSMSWFDSSTVYAWNVGDTVIIGVSDSLFNPNFLLNVNSMTQASGKAF